MESSSNIFRFNGKDPFDDWVTSDGVLSGYYPRNSMINQITQNESENGIGVYSNYCVIRSNVKTIGRSCFRNNIRFRNIAIMEGVTTIEEFAFYNTKFGEIGIPRSVKHMRANSFSKEITLFVYKDSYGEKYAIKHGFKYEYYQEEE